MSYGFNSEEPKIMWIDLNSAFATAEQQAHPSLRGRPMGVTNRVSKNCCVIAASYEAKALGIKTGTRRVEALALCPDFVLLETDPPKYHSMYQKLANIMRDYSPSVKMASIDEGMIDFHGMRASDLVQIGHEIKARVRAELGQYVRVNIGIGPNRFLAKTAASLHKPDGLDLIDYRNLLDVYKSLKLEDLTGIASGYGSRLRAYNIFTPLDFLGASEQLLTKNVFRSINGYYWYQRLRGYEIDGAPTKFGLVGRQWVVKNATNDEEYLRSCLHYLAETSAMKLRYRGASARGVCVWLNFQAGGGFHDKRTYKTAVYSNQDIWLRVSRLFDKRPRHMTVMMLGLYLYNLEPDSCSQLDLFSDMTKVDHLTSATDEINDRYGSFTIYSADSLTGTQTVKQKIPFGGTEYFSLLLGR